MSKSKFSHSTLLTSKYIKHGGDIAGCVVVTCIRILLSNGVTFNSSDIVKYDSDVLKTYLKSEHKRCIMIQDSDNGPRAMLLTKL